MTDIENTPPPTETKPDEYVYRRMTEEEVHEEAKAALAAHYAQQRLENPAPRPIIWPSLWS